MLQEEEQFSFDHLPKILSTLRDDVKEIKDLIIQGQNEVQPPDEWLDVKALQAYHPNHPAKKTIYDWVFLTRIPYHKDGKRLRFKRSEIDEWLLRGYHKTDEQLLEDSVDIINSKWKGLI